MTGRWRDLGWAGLGLVALLLVAVVGARPAIRDFIMFAMAYGLLAMSLNLLIGYTGLVSFGHAMFFASGAYAFGLAMQSGHFSIPAAFVFAIGLTVVLALVIGAICVRLNEIYFAFLTLAFQMLIYNLILGWVSFTGGDQGLTGGIPRPKFLGIDLADRMQLYVFCSIAFVICVAIMRQIVTSPFGYTLRLIRDNQDRAAFLGVDVVRVKLVCFVISACIAAVGGILLALFVSGAYPNFAFWTTSGESIFMIMLGGSRVFLGPLLGTIILRVLNDVTVVYTSADAQAAAQAGAGRAPRQGRQPQPARSDDGDPSPGVKRAERDRAVRSSGNLPKDADVMEPPDRGRPMRVSLVYNSKSGGATHSGKELKALLGASGYSVAHCVDKKSNWKALIQDPGDLVVVAGGDGTVGKVALAFAQRDVPIALLPTGTANNVARMLAIEASSPEEHIAGWPHAGGRSLDIGVASGPWGRSAFIEGVGFGLLASVMAQLNTQDKHSHAKRDDRTFKLYRDRLALKALATSYRPMALSGAVDGVGFSGEYLLVEALNIRSVGPALELAPDAEPDDGLLDLVMVPVDRREDFIDYLTDMLQGTSTPAPVEVRRGRRLTLTANRHDAHIDDRLWRAAARPPAISPDVEIKAQSHAVTILTPRERRDDTPRPLAVEMPAMAAAR